MRRDKVGIIPEDQKLKPNVKNMHGDLKQDFACIPPYAIAQLGSAMRNGALKYGRFNWRNSTVNASVYYNSIMRHLISWYSGEDSSKDSQLSHLAHIMANCAILLDAEENETFVDDRPIGKILDNETNIYETPGI